MADDELLDDGSAEESFANADDEDDYSGEAALADLRERAARGDRDAADQLIEMAGERGDLDELRRFADQGNRTAVDELIQAATEQGDLGELKRLAGLGSRDAADVLMELTEDG